MQSITFRNLSKSYAGIAALKGVDLDLRRGEVHALMGENGAGKSTLIKLIAGVVRADAMRVEIDGAFVPLVSAKDASAAGFRFIHQELNIIPQLSAAENILLGRRLPRRFGLAVDWRTLNARATQALAMLGVNHIAVEGQAGGLASGDKMLIKIASALVSDGAADAVLYVFDEPTAALTAAESEKLFDVIARLKQRGAAILYVSHRMTEVLQICDRVTVLRDGKKVLSQDMAGTSGKDIIEAMTGRDVQQVHPPRHSPIGAKVVCAAENVTTQTLRALNFTLREGEVLGIAGLAEAGQSEVLQAFLGTERALRGSLMLAGRPAPTSPAKAWARGVAYVPRERRSDGVMLGRAIRDNVMLPHLGPIGFLANRHSETAQTKRLAAKVSLKSTGPAQSVWQLSGGNQQKVVFARALGGNPQLLLLDEPTRGVDVGAKFDIYTLIRDHAAKGGAVILASSDLAELLGMCDRILILHNGRQMEIVATPGLTMADLLARFYDAAPRSPPMKEPA